QTSRDGNPEIDGRADVYSLAAMAYEMLSGLQPFQGETVLETRRRHFRFVPPLVDKVVKELPEGVGIAIARALSKDRVDRQATAGELVDALRAEPAPRTDGAAIRAGAPSVPTSNLAPGTVLDGKYRVEAILGSGAMGAVYRAMQLNLQRRVAIKVLRV